MVPLTRTTYSLRTLVGDGVRLRRVGVVDDDLGDAVAVTQVEEDELAQVTPTVDPAGEGRRLADVRRAVASAQVRVR